MVTKITSQELYKDLIKDVKGESGCIKFEMAGISFKIEGTDTVGKTLQEWVKNYLQVNNYYFDEPDNTQEFPDFYLSENRHENLLELKSFKYQRTPAFDIANFDSYCTTLKELPYKLYADYLIFGYAMEDGIIKIEDLWVKKIWEIAGTSSRFPLKTQVKKDVIYNIRPNSDFKYGRPSVFKNEYEFLNALYETIALYRNKQFADSWKKEFEKNYKKEYGKILKF